MGGSGVAKPLAEVGVRLHWSPITPLGPPCLPTKQRGRAMQSWSLEGDPTCVTHVWERTGGSRVGTGKEQGVSRRGHGRVGTERRRLGGSKRGCGVAGKPLSSFCPSSSGLRAGLCIFVSLCASSRSSSAMRNASSRSCSNCSHSSSKRASPRGRGAAANWTWPGGTWAWYVGADTGSVTRES